MPPSLPSCPATLQPPAGSQQPLLGSTLPAFSQSLSLGGSQRQQGSQAPRSRQEALGISSSMPPLQVPQATGHAGQLQQRPLQPHQPTSTQRPPASSMLPPGSAAALPPRPTPSPQHSGASSAVGTAALVATGTVAGELHTYLAAPAQQRRWRAAPAQHLPWASWHSCCQRFVVWQGERSNLQA